MKRSTDRLSNFCSIGFRAMALVLFGAVQALAQDTDLSGLAASLSEEELSPASSAEFTVPKVTHVVGDEAQEEDGALIGPEDDLAGFRLLADRANAWNRNRPSQRFSSGNRFGADEGHFDALFPVPDYAPEQALNTPVMAVVPKQPLPPCGPHLGETK